MKYKVVESEINEVDGTMFEIKRKLAGEDVHLIVYYASYLYPGLELCKKMAESFPGVETMGCTSSCFPQWDTQTSNFLLVISFVSIVFFEKTKICGKQ